MPACATRFWVVTLLALCPLWARAEPTLAVELAEGCPDAAQFHERMGTLLGDRPAPSTGLVRVLREGQGYRLDVETPDVSRTLRNEDCAELVESAAVIVALGAAARDVPEPEPVPLPPAEVAPAPTPPAPVAAAPRRLGAWLEASGSYGLVPHTAWRAALGARFGRPRVGGTLGLDYMLPRTSHAEQGVRVHAAGTSLGAYVAIAPRLTLDLGGALHLLWGRGQGLRDARSGQMPLGSARVALSVALVERRSMQLALVLTAGVPFARGRFRYADGGTAHRPDVMNGSVGLAFGFARER